jgi:hypothetical protein
MTTQTTFQTSREVSAVDTSIRGWLRFEGAVAFISGLALFGWLGGPWLLVIPLLLLPDLSAVGYLRSPQLGALTYNAAHTWAPGLALLAAGLVADVNLLAIAGTIFVAHVGMDRLAGYGLKLPTSFHDTHMGRIGKDRAQS